MSGNASLDNNGPLPDVARDEIDYPSLRELKEIVEHALSILILVSIVPVDVLVRSILLHDCFRIARICARLRASFLDE